LTIGLNSISWLSYEMCPDFSYSTLFAVLISNQNLWHVSIEVFQNTKVEEHEHEEDSGKLIFDRERGQLRFCTRRQSCD
jgi:hypothetical protein